MASSLGDRDPQLAKVLKSAAHLQRLVPDAVLVGGTAAIVYADHPESLDHDHVLSDLADRFELVLDALEADEGWATNRVTPGKVILGNLDGIEAGVRHADQRRSEDGIASQLVRQLSDPQLSDPTATRQLIAYRRLGKRWREWSAVTEILGRVATAMVVAE
jgi:hypothetical protein